MKPHHILIVGAGFSGAVIARELADAGVYSSVIDCRSHLAGNCHTARASDCGVFEHHYGPHTFHTSDLETWQYIQRFGKFMPFIYRVKASTNRGIFSLPINLHTINQFFGARFTPDEARTFLAGMAKNSIDHPQNFEELAIQTVGPELYKAFFYGYTRKQWGCEPRDLPSSIFRRLPIRYNYDDNYFSDPYCGIPPEGYTAIVERMLDHPLINVSLRQLYEPGMADAYKHIFYSGPIDAFYNYCCGHLGYRSVYWERLVFRGDYQGNAVINYPDLADSHTRVIEYKHFTAWEEHEYSSVYTEYSKETGPEDVPAYPKRLQSDLELLTRYQTLAGKEKHITFIGRLGTYRYLNMDRVIKEARQVADTYLNRKGELS